MGAPRLPAANETLNRLLDLSFEPEDGSPPPEFWAKVQWWKNVRFAEDYGMTEEEVVRMLERMLLEKLGKREEPWPFSRVISAIGKSGDPASAPVLEKALFAEWNPGRCSALVNLLNLSGDAAALDIARRVAADTRLFEPWDRHLLYKRLSESAEARGGEWKRAVVAFLRERTASEEDQGKTTILDGLLLKADPGWARSEGRRRLAARIAAQTPENPVVIGFRNLLKEIGEPSGAP